MTDGELLARYVSDNSQEAFTAIVARHTGMVYATCVRVLGDRSLAEDATQAVFLVLTRKARGLAGIGVLSGWLYKAAENTARNMLKMRARRVRHEREAMKMR